jgi:mRNA interferase RelE/StbE
VTAFYKVSVKKSAEKELRQIPAKVLDKIIPKIKSLASDPRPHGAEKMEGGERYRVRQGDWRFIYTIDDSDQSVMVVKIGNRKEVYRR